jgi:hypothetical protein
MGAKLTSKPQCRGPIASIPAGVSKWGPRLMPMTLTGCCPFHLVDSGTLGPAAAIGRGAWDTTDSQRGPPWLRAEPPRSGFQRTEAHAPTGDVNVAGTARRQELRR